MSWCCGVMIELSRTRLIDVDYLVAVLGVRSRHFASFRSILISVSGRFTLYDPVPVCVLNAFVRQAVITLGMTLSPLVTKQRTG